LKDKKTTHNTRSMFIGWLTCIPAVLLPHSPCPSADGQRMLPPSPNGQMPIAWVVMGKILINITYEN